MRFTADGRTWAFLHSRAVESWVRRSSQGHHQPCPLMTQIEQLTTWLNSAYSMEQSLAKVLENHAKDASEHPDIQSRIQEHMDETKHHAERVRECLRQLGTEPSTLKSAVGNIVGMVQGASTGMFRDELVKNMLSDYASEHFEIACYRSLISAAEEAGRPDIAEICSEILEDEAAMAEWIEEQIPEVTRLVLHQGTHA